MVTPLVSKVEDRISAEGGEFTFKNALALSSGDKWIISPYNRTDSMGTSIPNTFKDYAPFDAITVDNASNEKIRVYINASGISNTVRSMPVQRLSVRTYDLTRITELTIVNEGSGSISISDIDVMFQRVAANVDTIAEAVVRKMPIIGRRPLLADQRSFF